MSQIFARIAPSPCSVVPSLIESLFPSLPPKVSGSPRPTHFPLAAFFPKAPFTTVTQANNTIKVPMAGVVGSLSFEASGCQ